MKKLSSKHQTIKFNMDSNTRLHITPDGIIVSDEVAAFTHKRLGDANVSVEDVDIEEAIQKALQTTENMIKSDNS